MSTLNLRVLIEAVDRMTGPLRRMSSQLDRFRGAAIRVGSALRSMTRLAGSAVIALTSLAGVSLGSLGLGVLSTGRTFERFRTQLKTMEGSSEAAERSMRWIEQFAKRTPYDLQQVTDAFVAMRSYGIDPTDGSLASLGDLAAGMGKPLMQAVEALSDAQNGEFERLKELGIRASAESNQIALTYEKDGRSIRVTAAKNATAIRTALMGIVDARFAGAMEEQSKTFDGMWSNLLDQFTNFKKMVADGGVFAFVKNELASLLAVVNRLSASGKLAAWAKEISTSMVEMFVNLKKATEGVDWVGAIKGLFAFIGGTAQLIKAIGGISGIITSGGMVAIGWLTTTAMAAGVAIAGAFGVAAAPVAAVIAVIGLVALAGWTLYRNWGAITGKLKEMWSGFVSFLGDAWKGIQNVFKTGVDLVWRGLPPWFRMILQGAGFVLKVATNAVANTQPGGSSAPRQGSSASFPRPAIGPSSRRAEVGGAVDSRVHSDGRAQVTRLQSANPAVPLQTMSMYRGANGR